MLNWVLILGGCGLVAGIWGPIRFNPTFQMGPLVGVFITGPLGVMLGVAGFFISRWQHVPLPVQWRIIAALAALLVTGTVLSSFPGPTFRAFIVNSTVLKCRPVNELRDELIAQWQERINNIKSEEPAAGWQERMHATLESAHGVVIDARVLHRTEIREQQKPWNRGTLKSYDRTKTDEVISYVDDSAGASCANYAAGTPLETLIDYVSQRPLSASNDWPPTDIGRILSRLNLKPVPTEYLTKFGRSRRQL